MRISINVTNYSWPGGRQAFGAELTRVVEAADRSGVDTVWVADHLLQADPTAGPDQTEMYEAYTFWDTWRRGPDESGLARW